MKHTLLSGLAASLLAFHCAAQSLPPAAPSVPATDTYAGTTVEDPYRNLEKLADPAVQQWLKAQAAYARQTLDAIPGRTKLVATLRELDNRSAAGAYDIRITGNGRQFFLRTTAPGQPARLYSRPGQQGPETLLFDPAPAKSLIAGFVPSPDGSKVAFVLMGTDAQRGKLVVLNVATKKLYPERLGPMETSFAASWLADNNSIAYSPLDNSVQGHYKQALVHRVGTPQSQDKPVFSPKLYPRLFKRQFIGRELAVEASDESFFVGHGGTEEFPELTYDPETKLLYGVINSNRPIKHMYQ